MAHGGIKPWQLFAALGILLIFLFVIFTPQGQVIISGTTSTATNTTQVGKVVVTKPLQLGCVDPLAGANCGAVTVKLYAGSSQTLLETLTASGSGVATSTNSYTSGSQLTLAISGNSKATEYIPLTVPTAYTTDSNIVVSVYAVTLGAWTQVFTGTGGTSFATGFTTHLSQFAGSTVTVTDSISETTSNAGYKSSYDITNLLNQYWVLQVSDGGGASSSTQYATITGLPNLNKVGNTNYYFVICPDGLSGSGVGSAGGTGAGSFKVVSGSQSAGTFNSQCSGALSENTIGTNVYGGSAGFSFSIAAGSLTAGNSETLTYKMYYYGDPAYFAANGNLGPNAAQSGSSSTLVVYNQ